MKPTTGTLKALSQYLVSAKLVDWKISNSPFKVNGTPYIELELNILIKVGVSDCPVLSNMRLPVTNGDDILKVDQFLRDAKNPPRRQNHAVRRSKHH